jgi:hypothetical protein
MERCALVLFGLFKFDIHGKVTTRKAPSGHVLFVHMYPRSQVHPCWLDTGVALYRQDVEIELGCDQGRLCIWFTVDSVEKADNLILCAQPLIYTVKVTTLPHAYTSRVM